MLEFRPRGSTAATAVLLLANSTSAFAAQVTSKVTPKTADAPGPYQSPSTCPSRSINYITHSLPQQCFTASWASRVPSQSNSTVSPTSTVIEGRNFVLVTSTVTTVSEHSRDQLDQETQPKSQDPLDATSTVPDSKNTASSSEKLPQISRSISSEIVQETETDSPLDNANFLSFEEWKKKNLEKAGQSAENLGAKSGAKEQRRRPGGISNALDSLGEDAEIDIDFGGFASQGPMANAPLLKGAQVRDSDSLENIQQARERLPSENAAVRKRPRDAGKTCKERTNYASYDCAATTLKTNPECKSPSAILVENKDSYMLNICTAKNKFFIVELCNDILIDTIVLANFEFFSSMFRTFRVSVSDNYPVKLDKWKELGTYDAQNSRNIQAFLIENPLIWARYLRVEMLSQYGNEYYCPVSLLRVHGTTMIDEFNSEMKSVGGEDEGEGEGEQISGEISDQLPPQLGTSEVRQESTAAGSRASSSYVLDSTSRLTETLARDAASTAFPSPRDSTSAPQKVGTELTRRNSTVVGQLEDLFGPWLDLLQTCSPSPNYVTTKLSNPESPMSAPVLPTAHGIISPSKAALTTISPSSATQAPSLETTSILLGTNESIISLSSSAASVSNAIQNTIKSVASKVNSTTISSVKAQASSNQQPPSNPTTQESFFKSVHKRLQMLEANSTLSLQYIEEQSRILRDAFSKVEKRQLSKSTTFLETLNSTVLTELLEFRRQYDQIWQSTVLELSSQREQSQQEVFALSTRLTLLADEIVFQKRMTILQSLLILLCLGLVIFSKSGSSSSYMEFRPFVQNAINKSSANLSRYATHLESPSSSPSASRPPSRYGLFRSLTHRRSPSEESYVSKPNIEYSPPTPESQGSMNDELGSSPGQASQMDGDNSDGPPEAEQEVRSKSSPVTPEASPDGKRHLVRDVFLTTDSPVKRGEGEHR
ncbi:uncharacterized protein KY384_003798 [Bacidia gigantensis]|uniref:uncharacterized protein n=1 Tax=Bacidia gigantensis TaxID=2732470 RepID=UPI001D04402C|nr:uncharacterized protein KY384_003798 [Bacidia gigantensis]KAG8532158.1 hypothetical protein KY384_003798 [Bacidia gigantensis]